jgi:hypothetical protein
MERLMSVAALDQEAKFRGQCLFVDADGQLKIWGRQSKRGNLPAALRGREEEMKRFFNRTSTTG